MGNVRQVCTFRGVYVLHVVFSSICVKVKEVMQHFWTNVYEYIYYDGWLRPSRVIVLFCFIQSRGLTFAIIPYSFMNTLIVLLLGSGLFSNDCTCFCR
jgi:hypothetical protein